MQLVERHIIKKSNKFYREIDNLCFLSKNLYNVANYTIRQGFFSSGAYLSYNKLDKLFNSTKNVDYYNLPCKVSQQILMVVDRDWKSFFEANKKYKLDSSKFLGKPKPPNYKDKVSGRNMLIYSIQAISKKELKKGIIKLSGTNIRITTKVKQDYINQVRILVRNNYYVVEVVYTKEEKEIVSNGRNVAVDLGLNNLATIIGNFNNKKLIVNGKPLKTINQYYNKKKANLQSFLKDKFTSNNLSKLTNKRNFKIQDYLHKASRYIVNYCLTNNVSKIVIGYNKQWKQGISMGKRNNQNFVNIPFKTFINMISYKSMLACVEVILNEESYTSKCSFVDDEAVCKHETYSGRRIKRGLFKSKNNITYNADVNGALNIMRKAVPTFSVRDYGIEGVVVHPIKVTL